MPKIHNAYSMMYNQTEIESLNEEDYSMFLAYGDTISDKKAVPVRAGSDFLWPPEDVPSSTETGGEELRFRVCVRNRKHIGGFAAGYKGA